MVPIHHWGWVFQADMSSVAVSETNHSRGDWTRPFFAASERNSGRRNIDRTSARSDSPDDRNCAASASTIASVGTVPTKNAHSFRTRNRDDGTALEPLRSSVIVAGPSQFFRMPKSVLAPLSWAAGSKT